MRAGLKWLTRVLLGDYSVYHVLGLTMGKYSSPSSSASSWRFVEPSRRQIESSEDPIISDQAWYLGDDARAFAILEGSRVVCFCSFWYRKRYHARNFWPLLAHEAKLVQIVTVPDRRGIGVATALISQASQAMFVTGFTQLYARVWHSNYPSLRAFRGAGWDYVATVVQVHLLRRKKPFRVLLNARPRIMNQV